MSDGPTDQLTPGVDSSAGGWQGPPPLLAVGSLLAQRFRIRAVIGAGSSAVVYRALDETSEVAVALKVYGPSSAEPANRERIRREVELSWRVQHPSLIRVFDWGEANGRFYLVMELCAGGTLRARMTPGSGLPVDEVCAYARAILSALAALHREGVVHRDVKPENCLLMADGHLKLADLGLVQADYWATLTATGTALGTPRYMSPEAIRGHEVGPGADLYSLGVTLYELLAGEAPFAGASAFEVANKHLSAPPPLARLRVAGTPRWLIGVISRLLEKRPGDRFASAEAVLRAVERRTAGFRLARRTRRRLMIALATTLALVAAGTWLVGRGPAAPATAAIAGNVLEARDAAGRSLWKKALPRDIQSAHVGHFGPGGEVAVACAIRWGMPGEGPAEPFWKEDGWRNALYVYDARGALVDSCPIKLWPPPGITERYMAQVGSHRFRPGEPERLVVQVNHVPWYPSGLLVYPPARADNGGRSWLENAFRVYNSGHIQGWTAIDLTGDRTDELVFAAVNNRLYRAIVVGAARVQDARSSSIPLSTFGSVASPDVAQVNVGRPLFYRAVGFFAEPYTGVAVDRGSGRLLLSTPRGANLEVEPDGALRRAGAPVGPGAATVARLNGLLTTLCSLRDQGSWAELLAATGEWPPQLSEPYGWLGALFRAHALEGLGRYRDELDLLDRAITGGEAGDVPLWTNQLQLDAAFLGGDYRGCVEGYLELPPETRAQRWELADTAQWAALYCGFLTTSEGILSEQRPAGLEFSREHMLALLSWASGDYAGAAARLKGFEARAYWATPGLLLVDCLLRRGKVGEARAVMNRLGQLYPDARPAEGDTGLWLRWQEGERSPGLVAAMEQVVEDQRRLARTDVDTRALLPLAIARAARMHRDLGDVAKASLLLTEAQRLGPPSWRMALAYDDRPAGSAR